MTSPLLRLRRRLSTFPLSISEHLLFGGRLLSNRGFSRHETAQAHFSLIGVVRDIPLLAQTLARLTWKVERSALLTVLVAEILQSAARAFILLSTNKVLAALFSSGTVTARLRTASPSLLGIATAAALVPVFLAFSTAAVGRLEPAIERQASIEVLMRAIRVELSALEDAKFHHLLDSAQFGADAARRIIGESREIINALFTMAATGTVLAVMHPSLLPLLTLIAVPRGWGAVRTARREYFSTQAWLQHMRASRLLTQLLSDQKAGSEVRVHGIGPFLLEHFKQMSSVAAAEQALLARAKAKTDLAASFLAGLATLATYLVLAFLLTHHFMALAVAGTAVFGIRSGAASMTALVTRTNGLYREALYIADLRQLAVEGDRLAIPSGGTEVDASPKSIELEEVSFTYPGRKSPSLDKISLSIKRGHVIALVGENGSGKTTLAKLIAGLYQPTFGRITWDGTDTRKLDRDQLFAQVAMLAQDFQRWPFTVRTNVNIGRPKGISDCDPEALGRAAEYANLMPLVNSLPSGWDTLLSRSFAGGIELSGGQWQRLGLARAHYRSASILICDEPTSALDPKSEIEAFNRIRKLADEGRTIILITHRLASVRHADRIYVLHEGRVVEHGTYPKLMERNALFASLYRLQARQYRDTADH
ncbi:ABC transporter ATP-binding protein [Streptomyces sp. NPDC086783]|uniref:ABC transporter ATP-binding protein n=1 Tax=Streptomyces sp. NPDC086783 TaxID=3365758 RepID=UPI0037FF3904